jgi:alpha-beta hydrolase superfamily lysophospholipase
MPEPTVAAFDEAAPLAPRGTVVVFVGRGEHPGVYERLGRRLAADAWRVRVVAGHTDAEVLQHAQAALGTAPVEPVVLLGSDDGAARATRLAGALGADGLVLGGVVPPGHGTVHFADWDAEVAARTSCPAHRARLGDDSELERDALAATADTTIDTDVDVPVLALHGAADQVVPMSAALPVLERLADAEVLEVRDGVHDVFNDIVHRSVAASVVLFLERLRAGGEPIVRRVPASSLTAG